MPTTYNIRYFGVWEPSTSYSQNNMVFYGGSFWIANTTFTSGLTFDENNWTCPECPEPEPEP